MSALRVFHLIERYLPPSQVWLYLLLNSTADSVHHHIGTREILSKQFNNPGFAFHIAKEGQYRLGLKKLTGGRLSRYRDHLWLSIKNLSNPSERSEWSTLVEDKQIDLIHVHFAPHACEHLSWLLNSSVPFVISFYGYDYENAPFLKPSLIPKYRQLFQKAAAVICEGKHGQEILAQRFGCPRSKLHCVPLGIDLQAWPRRQWEPKIEGQLRLIQVADFTPKKGQIDTIKAACAAKKSVPDLKLTLVGQARDPSYWQTCQQQVEHLNATDWIHFRDFVPIAELGALLQKHDAFIHPSRYTAQRDCEGGAPTILFYAQAFGLPVISTLHCDIPHVVEDPTAGILVSEGDIEGLSQAIKTMACSTTDSWAKWQQRTMKWGHSVADVKKGAGALLQLYRSLVHQ